MTAAGLLQRLEALDVAASIDGADLVLDGRTSALTPELIAQLRASKPEVLAHLRHLVAARAGQRIAEAEERGEFPEDVDDTDWALEDAPDLDLAEVLAEQGRWLAADLAAHLHRALDPAVRFDVSVLHELHVVEAQEAGVTPLDLAEFAALPEFREPNARARTGGETAGPAIQTFFRQKPAAPRASAACQMDFDLDIASIPDPPSGRSGDLGSSGSKVVGKCRKSNYSDYTSTDPVVGGGGR